MRQKTGGRSKGTPNPVTAQVREVIAALAEANVGKLQTWLDAVAARDPAKAPDLLVRLPEYHVPKLARTECSTEVQTQPVTHRIVFGRAPKRTEELDT